MSEIQLRNRTVSRHYSTWANKLQNGLRRHRKARWTSEARGGFEGTALHLAGPEELLNDAVTNAIGTFWIALLQQPDPVVYGYGPATLFERAGNPPIPGVTAAGVVPRSDTFIMPLLFTSSARDQYMKLKRLPNAPNSIGHFLLAVSSQAPDEPMNIRTTIMNSMPSMMNGLHGRVQNAYTDLVTNSGWLGVDSKGNPRSVQPNFVDEEDLDVPGQQGINTCGLYVILNAWAHMLNIPVTAGVTDKKSKRRANKPNAVTKIKSRRRANRNWRSYRQFHTTAIEIINLAMAGHMDSETVQAFFNVYGYSNQVLHEEAQKPMAEQVRRVDAVRMTSTTLTDEIETQKVLDEVSAFVG